MGFQGGMKAESAKISNKFCLFLSRRAVFAAARDTPPET
jgi:hypothetical protein